MREIGGQRPLLFFLLRARTFASFLGHNDKVFATSKSFLESK
jgi:hypothetical protein